MSRSVVILGSGLKAMIEAHQLRQTCPEAQVMVVGRASQPGGRVRTLRIEGFHCELGPEAYRIGTGTQALLEELGLKTRQVPLARPIPVQGEEPEVVTFLLRRILDDHDGQPASLRTGCEELVQALRRALDGMLMLGRPATAIHHHEGGYQVQVGGEVSRTLSADEVVLALPPASAGALLAGIDRECSKALQAIRCRSFTNVWLGLWDHDAREAFPTGSLILEEGPLQPFLAALDCTQLVPGRTVPGKALVRIVLDRTSSSTDLESLVKEVELALRSRTGLTGPTLMRRVMHAQDAMPARSERALLMELRAQVAEHHGLRML